MLALVGEVDEERGRGVLDAKLRLTFVRFEYLIGRIISANWDSDLE